MTATEKEFEQFAYQFSEEMEKDIELIDSTKKNNKTEGNYESL